LAGEIAAMKLAFVLSLGFTIALSLEASAAEKRVLVYTRNHVTNGTGYVHDNIATSVEAIRKIGAEHNFLVDVSDDPSVFSDQNLRKYRTLIFSNSNNEAFETDAQRGAFQRFIHRGGGFVGIHSASGSERHWPYFWSVLGGSFAAHPHIQTFTVQVTDKSLPGLEDLPASFRWTDECYFIGHLNPDIHPILTTPRKNLDGVEAMHLDVSTFTENLPLAWFHRFDHGREFYLALGHAKEDYSDPVFLKILTAGILWANH
jgi:type 1 glutamine amidotransferase